MIPPPTPDGGDDPRIGTVIDGRYRLVERLALGGMGVIYRAEHIKVARPVAIKFPHEVLVVNQDFVRRFQREAAALSRLTHPNIVSVVDYGVAQGVPYLAMEFHRGRSLGDLLDTGPLPARRAVAITRQVLSGLRHAHDASVVHRDLKPDNMLLLSDVEGDFVKILDFGLAKILQDEGGTAPARPAGAPADSPFQSVLVTSAGLAMGTLGYMSPEQFRGQPIDARSDLYAVGVVLYQMITGRRPHEADSPIDLLKLQTEQDPRPPRQVGGQGCCGPELDAVIMKALQRDPASRHQSASAFSEALEETPEGHTGSSSLWDLTPPPAAAVPAKVIRAPGPPSLPDPSLPSIPVGRPLPGMPPVRDPTLPLVASNLPGLAPPPSEKVATREALTTEVVRAPRRPGGRGLLYVVLLVVVLGGLGGGIWALQATAGGRGLVAWVAGQLGGNGRARGPAPVATPAASPPAPAASPPTAAGTPAKAEPPGAGAGPADAGPAPSASPPPAASAQTEARPETNPGPGDVPEVPEAEPTFPTDSPGLAREKTAPTAPAAPAAVRPSPPLTTVGVLRQVSQSFVAGRIDDAIDLLYSARRAHPNVWQFGLWLGHAYYRKGWRTDALREYAWTLSQRPDLRRDKILQRNVVNCLEGSSYRAASGLLVRRIGAVAVPEVRRLFVARDPLLRRRARAVAARLLGAPRPARGRPVPVRRPVRPQRR